MVISLGRFCIRATLRFTLFWTSMVINLERVSLKGSDDDLSAKECRNEGFAKIDLQISLRGRNFLQIMKIKS